MTKWRVFVSVHKVDNAVSQHCTIDHRDSLRLQTLGWHALPEQVFPTDKGFILWTKLILYTAEFHMQHHVYMSNILMTICLLKNRNLIYFWFTEAEFSPTFQFLNISFSGNWMGTWVFTEKLVSSGNDLDFEFHMEERDHPDTYSRFSSVSRGNASKDVKLGQDRFLPSPFRFIIHYHPITSLKNVKPLCLIN
jgi:hypothetical protein